MANNWNIPNVQYDRNQVPVSVPDPRAASSSFISPNSMVKNQMNEILSTESPLLRRAKSQGFDYANSRGLLNSDQAAAASMGSMMNYALPIASQDANTWASSDNLTHQQSNILDQMSASQKYNLENMGVQHGYNLENMGLQHGYDVENMGLQHGYDTENMGLQHGYDTENMGLQHGYNVENMGLQHGYDTENMGLQHGYDTEKMGLQHGYDTENMGLQHGYDTENMGTQHGYDTEILNTQHQNDLESAKNAADLNQRIEFGNNVTNMTNTLINGMLSIMGTPDQTWTQDMQDDVENIINSFKPWASGLFNIPLTGEDTNTATDTSVAPNTAWTPLLI